ncbi:uncharacterized protein LOC121764232 [Salvia splendens]|uniref:uncharacterized protein LOC121764232 n=1 Tax=Salvia splendens TaxID=180675 RepID=UPI001C278078|nr:uncharacterized protein LOC121764232 [Salvia splendens]
MIEDGEQVLTEEEDIRKSTENFFKRLLTEDVGPLVDPDLDIISSLPPHVDMDLLEKAPVAEEVRQIIFSMNVDSATGPDGYSALFFQSCWDIIGGDVTEAVLDFFGGSQIPRGIAATLIVLVPKKKNPTRWAEFRPISLCNVMNKIISKLLASRMAPLLPLLTVPNQSGFVKGRLLSDNVLLAKELFHEIWKGVTSPNMVLKLDMEKAYDRVQWSFLLKVLGKMGFLEKWLMMIGNCITPCWFSVLINGSVAGFFKSTRGLRQGDPISPSLFILAADYLSRLLDHLILDRKEMLCRTARYTMGISHLAYADDIMIFSQAKSSSILQITECLKHYMEVSGQKVNVSKSCFYLDKKHIAWAREVREVLEPTKGAMRQIEQVMALLADTVEAFSIKMWWWFRGSNRFSPMRRRLFKVGELCREQVRWVVGDGNINFWYDSWVKEYPLASRYNSRPLLPSLKVSDLWTGEQWNEMELWRMMEEEGLPEDVVVQILQIPFDRRVRDRGRWKLTGNGEFSVASAWELVRSKAGKRLIFEMIWGKERNESVHREKVFEVGNVIKKVNTQLRYLVLAKLIGPDQWRGCCPQLDVMVGVTSVGRRGRVERVQWRSPDMGWVKINVDGAFSPNTHRAGGGVVRDCEGEILSAFAAGFEVRSGLGAEVAAVLVGVALAKQCGRNIWIESDAELVVRWLDTGQLGPSEVCVELAKVRRELEESRLETDVYKGFGAFSGKSVMQARSDGMAEFPVLRFVDVAGVLISYREVGEGGTVLVRGWRWRLRCWKAGAGSVIGTMQWSRWFFC